MWHWFLDGFLIVCIIILAVDSLTFLWVKRCYSLVYHLMVWTHGCLILTDIDNFREFNNLGGHKTGNKVLRKVGLILMAESRCRSFRYGGDELVILLPWTSKEKAAKLAEKIRAKVEKIMVNGLQVTITCAVAHFEQDADRLLLSDGKGKRNTVVSE